MSVLLFVLTYFVYLFIVATYSVKSIKIARMPVHLRWELYPVIYELKSIYGSSSTSQRGKIGGHLREPGGAYNKCDGVH